MYTNDFSVSPLFALSKSAIVSKYRTFAAVAPLSSVYAFAEASISASCVSVYVLAFSSVTASLSSVYAFASSRPAVLPSVYSFAAERTSSAFRLISMRMASTSASLPASPRIAVKIPSYCIVGSSSSLRPFTSFTSYHDSTFLLYSPSWKSVSS